MLIADQVHNLSIGTVLTLRSKKRGLAFLVNIVFDTCHARSLSASFFSDFFYISKDMSPQGGEAERGLVADSPTRVGVENFLP
jgi:hypothetical protein